MKTILYGLLTMIALSFANSVSAQASSCGHVDGENVFFEGTLDSVWYDQVLDVPDDGTDATWTLTYCLEMWDSDGGYMKLVENPGAEFFVTNGHFEYGVDGGSDDYLERSGYPNWSDVNYYVVDNNGDGWFPEGGEDYLVLDIMATPFATVNVRLTARWAAN